MKKMAMKFLKAMLIFGGINWALAIFSINLVTMLLNGIPYAVNFAYFLVLLGAIFEIPSLIKKN